MHLKTQPMFASYVWVCACVCVRVCEDWNWTLLFFFFFLRELGVEICTRSMVSNIVYLSLCFQTLSAHFVLFFLSIFTLSSILGRQAVGCCLRGQGFVFRDVWSLATTCSFATMFDWLMGFAELMRASFRLFINTVSCGARFEAAYSTCL